MNKLPLRIAYLYGTCSPSRSWTLNYLASLSGEVTIDSCIFGESWDYYMTESVSWEGYVAKSFINTSWASGYTERVPFPFFKRPRLELA